MSGRCVEGGRGGREGGEAAGARKSRNPDHDDASPHHRPPPTNPQLLLSAQFLHNELPVRLAHRVAELENLPYGLSAKAHVLKV